MVCGPVVARVVEQKNVVRMKHELQAWHNRTDEIHDSVEVKKDEKKCATFTSPLFSGS